MKAVMFFNALSHISYFVFDFKIYLFLLFTAFVCLFFFINKIYKSKRTEQKKKILITLCFAVFFLIFIYSFFEAFFRYRYDESDGLGFLQTNQRWMGRHVVFNNYGY